MATPDFTYVPRGSVSSETEFQGATLVIPTVSVGNVGQLAMDLLIQSVSTVFVGYIDTPLVLSFAGNNAFDPLSGEGSDTDNSNRASFSIELFYSKEHKVVFFQQRAPTVRRGAAAFGSAVAQWAKNAGFTSVVTLCSAEASRRRDYQLAGDQFRYFTASSQAEPEPIWAKAIAQSGIKVLERADGTPPTDPSGLTMQDLQLLLHAGTTRALYRALGEKGIPSVFIMLFCSEGNNIMEGSHVAQACAMALSLKDISWKNPSSWSHLMGPPVDPSLY